MSIEQQHLKLKEECLNDIKNETELVKKIREQLKVKNKEISSQEFYEEFLKD